MIRLGGIVLPDETQWIDQDDWSPVVQTATPTLGGQLAFFSRANAHHRPITLSIQDGITWIDRATRDAIQGLAAQSGASFVLELDGDTHTVMFRHHEPPAVSFASIQPNYNLYVGTIKLLKV